MFYEYDTMKSPFQGFIGFIGRDMHYGECTYEYVDGYQVKRTHIIPNGGMDGKMEVRYEYEE